MIRAAEEHTSRGEGHADPYKTYPRPAGAGFIVLIGAWAFEHGDEVMAAQQAECIPTTQHLPSGGASQG